ncbi:MAG: hypothetical protein ACYTEL_09105 [Planctomycetota bacterium]
MKATRLTIGCAVVVFLVLLAPGRASAGSSFHLSIGSGHHSGFQGICRSHHKWHDGHQMWDRGHHGWRDGHRHRVRRFRRWGDFHRQRPICGSTVLVKEYYPSHRVVEVCREPVVRREVQVSSSPFGRIVRKVTVFRR